MTIALDIISPYHIRRHYAAMKGKESRRYSRHDTIHPDSELVYRIENGYARTTTLNEDGEISTLGIWGPGDYLGVPIQRTYPFTIEFLTRTQIALFKRDPDFEISTQWMLEYVQQVESLLNIQYQSLVRQRINLFLIWLSERFGYEVPEGKVIDLKLTHQEIAESVNSSRVTVTRTLKDLESEGRICWYHRKCVVVSDKQVTI